jgi:hypothetical protein
VLGARARADVGDARRRTGSGNPGGAGWDETAAVVDDLVERTCGPGALPGARPEAMRALCAAERSRHSDAPGPQPWRDAVTALTGADRPYLLSYARWRLAQAQVAARELGPAAESLRLSCAEATRLGARPLIAEVEAMAPARWPASGPPSPRGSGRSSATSRPVAPTARSRRRSSSAPRRPACTCRTSCGSCRSRLGTRPPRSPSATWSTEPR